MHDAPPSPLRLPDLDLAGLAADYAAGGRVRIASFLPADAAGQLRAHLERRTDWRLMLRAGGKALTYDAAQLAALSAAQRGALADAAAPSGEFGYRFQSIGAAGSHASSEAGTPLGAFADFIASAPVLAAVRAISGAADIASADAMATRYRPGDFLTEHHDHKPGVERRVAYVLNLNQGWRAEWGGLLMFHDAGGDIAAALLPRMNALTLFAVPQAHSVSLVAPFAPAPRHAVAGWFWAGEPVPSQRDRQ